MMNPFMDATEQAELVRAGTASPVELVEAAIHRTEALNGELNAVISPRFDQALEEAASAPEGPFRGVPYLLKDITLYSKGDPYASGIAGMRRRGYRADHDSYFVERMRDAGFILLGKSNTPEMALYATTEPVAWGPTRNPWDTGRSTGGSSGGSAAAVAAGMVPIAHGNDGGGSIRMPASHCGVVGLKPSRGRVSTGPMSVDSDNVSGMAVDLCLSRTVRDTAAVLDIVSGHRPGDGYAVPVPSRPFAEDVGRDPEVMRIGVLTHDPTGEVAVDPECAAAARHVASQMSDLGHEVEDGYPSALDEGSWPVEFMPCVAVLVFREITRLGQLVGAPLTEADIEPSTWALYELGQQVTGEQYAAGVDGLRTKAGKIEQWWEDGGWDLLLTPTMAATSPKLGELAPTPGDPLSAFSNALPYNLFTVPFNVSGQPAISIPLMSSADGLPLGIQLVAPFGREDMLLAVAAQMEQVMPWADRHPPIG